MFNKIENFFFREQSYFNLAVCRFLFYSYILYLHFRVMTNWIRFSEFPAIFYNPYGLFSFLKHLSLAPGFYENIFWVSIVFSFFAAIGFLGRISFVVSFLCFALINSLPQFYLTQVALNTPNFFVLLIFCFTDAGRFLSVDSFLFNRKAVQPGTGDSFSWPIRYFRYIHILFLFMAGMYKLRDSGAAWFTSDNLRIEFLCSHFQRSDLYLRSVVNAKMNILVAKSSFLTSAMAFSVLATELLSPLIFLNRKIKWLALGIIFSMQVVAVFFLFIDPIASLGLYLFWIEWDIVFKRLKGLRKPWMPRLKGS